MKGQFHSDTTLPVLFPATYTTIGSQNDSLAQYFLKSIIEPYTNKLDKTILLPQQQEYIQQISKKLNSFEFIFMTEYSSIIVLHQEYRFSPTSINLIFPTQWQFTTSVEHNEIKFFPNDPKSSNYMQIGTLKIFDQSLLVQKIKFAQHLKRIIQIELEIIRNEYQKKSKKNHHTPSWLYQMAKKAYQQYLIKCYSEDYPELKTVEEKKQEFETLSKGGTLDVGLHTGITKPNTTIEIIKAFINYLIQDPILSKILLLDTKIFFLKQEVAKMINTNLDYKKHRQCLNEIIDQARKIPHTSYNVETFKNLVVSLELQLNKDVIKKEPKLDINFIKNYVNNQRARNKNFYIEIVPDKIFNYNQNRNEGNSGLSFSIDKIENFVHLDTIKIDQTLWIIAAQKLFFKMAVKKFKHKADQFNVKLTEIEAHGYRYSILEQCVHKYFNIIKTKEGECKNGMLLKNQSYSHYYLIKYIAAALSFETVKYQRRNNKSNLENYRLPGNYINNLRNKFYSLSFQAREALQIMDRYQESNIKNKQLFVLQQSSESYYRFVHEMAEQEKIMLAWKTTKLKKLQTREKQIMEVLRSFERQYDAIKQRINTYQAQKCECFYQKVVQNNKQKQLLHECGRCIRLHSQLSAKKRIQYRKINSFSAEFSKKEINIYAFFSNIPPPILGMMKLFYSLQTNDHYQIKKKHKDNLFNDNLGPLVLISTVVRENKYKLSAHYYREVGYFINYPSDYIGIQYFDCSRAQKIDYSKLLPQKIENEQVHKNFQYMINEPDKDKSERQHQIYTNMNCKIKEGTTEQYIDLASIRVGQSTQIMVLVQKLKKRSIYFSTLMKSISKLSQFKQSQKKAKMLVVLNTLADIKAYLPIKNNQSQWKMQNECIQQFLMTYIDSWRYEDLYFIHIIAIVFSLLSRQVNYQISCILLAEKAFQQYNRFAEEVSSSQKNSKSHLAFFLHGILCCFIHPILQSNDKNAIMLWSKAYFLFKINKVYSDQNFEDERYKETINLYDSIRQRAVMSNIQSVKQFFKVNCQAINSLVSILINDFQFAKWSYEPGKGEYIFKGQSSKNTYQINFMSGILLKNGAEISGLPEIIKTNGIYKQIFGADRNFQVFPTDDGYLRTVTSFNENFTSEKNVKIYFQFKYDTTVKFRLIFKSLENGSETVFSMIPPHSMKQWQFQLPDFYKESFFAWHCESKNLVIFRKKSLKQMKDIGLIFLLRNGSNLNGVYWIKQKYQIVEARVIENKYKKQPLQFLCDQNNSKLFDHLVLFPPGTQKSNKYSTPIQVLSSIQEISHIVHIQTQTQVNGKIIQQTKFWLHRYNLKFTHDLVKGLISDNYLGYKVDQNYRNNEFLPWSMENQVSCLILTKVEDNIRLSRQHQKLILIPDKKIKANKMSLKLHEANYHYFKIFTYQIHDHFNDLRSKSRLEQLHLACLISACQNTKKSQNSLMSHSQYAVNLLRSCISIVPLTREQTEKIEMIQQNSIHLKQYSVFLMCLAIKTASNMLRYILPFNNRKIQVFDVKSIQKDCNQRDLISSFKNSYQKYILNNEIGTRGRLNQLELKLLNLDSVINFQRAKQMKLKIQNYQRIDYSNEQDYNLLLQNHKLLSEKLHQSRQNIVNTITEDRQPKNVKMEFSLDQNCKMSQDYTRQIQVSLQSYQLTKQKYEKCQINQKILNKLKDKTQYIFSSILQFTANLQKYLNQMQNYYSEKTKKSIIELKKKDFVDVMCNQKDLEIYFPTASTKSKQRAKQMIKLWFQMTIISDSQKRVLMLLSDKNGIDKVNLLRQLQSPREAISKHPYWLCFEVQMKSQIWLSQYETYKLLRQSQSGTVTQLNMGQGKTQIIIPMIVLDLIYNKNKQALSLLPRINILTPLYQQAQNNYFKFFSVTNFKISIFPIYFNRTVKMNRNNMRILQYAVQIFKEKSLILIDRQSNLSMILKVRQEYGYKGVNNFMEEQQLKGSNLNQKDKWIFRDNPILDIFDEVDALMTSKKSFVYAVGNCQLLPQSRIRFEYNRILLNIIAEEMLLFLILHEIAVCQQHIDLAILQVKEGKFPKGFRLLNNLSPEKVSLFRNQIIKHFFKEKYRPAEFQFFVQSEKNKQDQIIQYIIKQQTQIALRDVFQKLSEKFHSQIYALRGIIAFGVLQYCLSLRNGVDYGCPGKENPKRMGVPYEAADVPSKRSEYSHPEVATILSYLSYFNKGLSQKQFQQAMKYLLRQAKSTKNYNYKLWVNSIQDEADKPYFAMEARQINFQSSIHRQKLYEIFRYCRNTVAFWLIHCVFIKQFAQYPQTITASSWDIADSAQCLGFSGTKDTHWLFPTYLSLKPSLNHDINSTDGKMISLMLKNTLNIIQIEQNKQNLWKRFCQNCLKLKVGCIIDAGAILAGRSLQIDIIPWISKHKLFKELSFKGITFCDQNGIWKVYDIQTHTFIDRDSSIPQHQTFVIFDEARTRGADIKLDTQVVAALSISPNITKDKLMQAVGRLRKFGRNQKIYIVGTSKTLKNIKYLQIQNNKVTKIKKLIQWACENTINENKKNMYPNAKLAWIHFDNIYSKKGVTVQSYHSTVEKMYKRAIRYETISNLNEEMAQNHMKKYGQSRYYLPLINVIDTFGREYLVKDQQLEGICERQMELTEQNQKEQQKELLSIQPLHQMNQILQYSGKISTLDFRFDQKLKFSNNFINCTAARTELSNVNSFNFDQQNNELMQIHFVKINPLPNAELLVVTQRQACMLMQRGIKCVGPRLLEKWSCQVDSLIRFDDLKQYLTFVKRQRLENAVVQAQFFNGIQTFKTNFSKDKIIQMILKNGKRLIYMASTEAIITHFLQRRRTLEQKYLCSDLHDIFKKLNSSISKSIKRE